MKKICTILLMLTLLLSSLSSCYPTTEYNVQPNIKLSSSHAKSYGDYLASRLKDHSVNATIGIGGSSEYGLSMTDFEDDGYIIKTVGDETVIFGKTELGLDLACRKYANDIILHGTAHDTSYHEGYRIDSFALFGSDISEYSVVYSDGLEDAAARFVKLVKQACGISLNMYGNNVSCKAIRFTLSSDHALGDKGYRYYENNGDLYFEVSQAKSAVNAVLGFFEDECKWDSLTFDIGDLADQAVLDIPYKLNKRVTPAFDSIIEGVEDVYYVENGSKITCFSDEKSIAIIRSAITRYLKSCITQGNAPNNIGIVIGDGYCNCSLCAETLKSKGSTAATAITAANRLSEGFDSSGTPISIVIFAGSNTVPPSDVVPCNNVTVTLPADELCLAHDPLGNDCEDGKGSLFKTNLAKWTELTNNIHVSLNNSGDSLIQYYRSHGLYDTLRYLHTAGVKGVRLIKSELSFGFQEAEKRIAHSLNRNIKMAPLEYEELLCDTLSSVYGDGWLYLRQYIDLLEGTLITSSCVDQSSEGLSFNTDLYSKNYVSALDLMNTATEFAGSAEKEDRCRILNCHILYMGCMSSYYDAYYSADREAVESLSADYDTISATLEKFGVKIADFTGISHSPASDLFDAAWKDWIGLRDKLYKGTIPDEKAIVEFSNSVNSHIHENSFTLAFRTDTHYSSEFTESQKSISARAMEERNSVAHFVDIDLFVHGGDLINGKHDKNEPAYKSISEAVAITRGIHQTAPSFFVRGNHDDNSWYGYEKSGNKTYDVFPVDTVVTTEKWREITENDKFDSIVTDSTGAYGYFDHEESKIRVLLLDTSDIPYYDGKGNGNYKYGSYSGHGIREAQLQFMADAMMFSDKGEDASEWAILVISHVPIETIKTETTDYRFGGLDANGRNFFAFLRLLKAYQRGTDFDETVTRPTNYGDGGYISNGKWDDTVGDFAYDVSARFSKNGPGEVIGFITGHTHVSNYSNEVGKNSYVGSAIYPELSYGYSYFSVGTGGMSLFTIDRNGNGTGTIYVDHLGNTIVIRNNLISDGDNASVTTDKTMFNAVSSTPDTGTIASGKYSVKYYQNR